MPEVALYWWDLEGEFKPLHRISLLRYDRVIYMEMLEHVPDLAYLPQMVNLGTYMFFSIISRNIKV
ncbi:hypothetical protein [Serratia liquefaciens]|uniref:hypothetical protein n=1 Tax=Serratia liquefaciens TaxID=614 RepID=UPI000DFF76DD|nr:3-demethylubiquinone-9 3-methyltransferase [Serratia liquefaciens]